MRLSDCKVDVDKVDNGVWWDFVTKSSCPGNKPSENPCFLVLPNISGRYLAKLMEEQRVYAAILRKPAPEDEAGLAQHKTITEDITLRTRAKAMSATCLRGWANLEGDDGDTLVWSEAAAEKVLANREFLLILDFIERASENIDAVLAREEEQAKGN